MNKNIKILVAFSGGKDSQATLIWAVKKYGAKNVIAVYCDTGWENNITYSHINEVVKQLGVQLITLKNDEFDFIQMAKKKKRFPSSQFRFCTDHLKTRPMIDYILSQKEHLIILQGIRADESNSRSKMSKECRFFKYYFEPYGYDKRGKAKYLDYRKEDVKEWCKKYDDSLIRPVFNWSAQKVINYIRNHKQNPNPLYEQGFSRVGCFPCIMCNHNELKQISRRYPEKISEIRMLETQIGTFFPPDYIPERFLTKEVETKDGNKKKICMIDDAVNYVENKNATIDMFNSPTSCMSFYGLCE